MIDLSHLQAGDIVTTHGCKKWKIIDSEEELILAGQKRPQPKTILAAPLMANGLPHPDVKMFLLSHSIVQVKKP